MRRETARAYRSAASRDLEELVRGAAHRVEHELIVLRMEPADRALACPAEVSGLVAFGLVPAGDGGPLVVAEREARAVELRTFVDLFDHVERLPRAAFPREARSAGETACTPLRAQFRVRERGLEVPREALGVARVLLVRH